MIRRRNESGFTAVELLITLFVAAAFLVASYQLFNLIIKDGGATRSESRAANVAYDYLRQYSASATTIPCTASSPLNASPLTIDGLTNVTVDVSVTCLPDESPNLSQVTANVHYNVPQKTISYSMFTSSAGASSNGDITDGLVAWFKLNGNTNTSVGSPNGNNTDAISTTHDAVQNTAFQFNGTTANITAPSTYSLGSTNVTISCWVWNSGSTASNSGAFVNVGNGGNGYGIGIGSNRFDNGTPGTKIVVLYEGVRWIPTTTDLGTGWHHVVLTINGSGVPAVYLDGSLAGGTMTGTPPNAPTGSTVIGSSASGTARYYKGSIDDVRLYNRALSLSEIIALYGTGAQ